MEIEQFTQRLEKVSSEVDALDCAAQTAGQFVTMELSERLHEALEDLRTAEEEMRRQQNEIIESRMQAESERARYQALFDFAPDGHVVTDIRGVIRETNHAAGRLLGVSAGHLAGKPLVNFIPMADRSGFRKKLNTIMRDGLLRAWYLKLEPRFGTVIDASVSVERSKDPNTRTDILLWSLRDVTERTRLEQDLRSLNAELEQRVRDRTADLEAASRAKDEFLAMLAHELRNPLAPIRNSVILLRRHAHGTEASHTIDVLDRQSAHLARLVDDLLDVARFMQGHAELRLEPVELRSVLDDAVETVSALTQSRRHRIDMHTPSEPIPIMADPVRLSQVFANLLANAAKFTKPEGLITVEAARENDTAVVRVCDTGIGIAPEVLPHVFDLFTQADHSLDRSQSGLGIGLTLVNNLIRQHRGTVEAHSEGLGHGSQFIVRLPCVDPAAVHPPAPTPGVPGTEARTAGDGKGTRRPRILIVDDNVDAAVTLADILGSWDCEVRVRHDGPSGIEEAVSWAPDVILLDIGLPGMNGYEVARRLRQEGGLSGLCLVALTGYGREEDRERARAAGFHHYLVKPVDFQALEAVVTGDGVPPV